MVHAIQNEDPASISSLRSEVTPEWDWIARRALAKDPRKRYCDVAEMLADLRALRQQYAPSDTVSMPTWAFPRPGRRFLLAGAIFALAVAVGLLAWRWPELSGKLRPLTAGQPRQVTRTESWDGDPCLSPDGGRIAYASNAAGNLDIFVVDARGGNPIQLTDYPGADSEPTWFPDGRSLAFVSDRGSESGVWKLGQLGGGATLLVPDAVHPAISPDGMQVAFSRSGPSGYLRIAVASLAAPDEVRFLTGEEDGLWNHRYPAWSPDGSRICYAAHQNLWLVPVAGGPARKLTTEGVGDSEPVWSADGEQVYFSSSREGIQALWQVDAGGGKPHRLTMGTGPERHPSVAATGGALAYSTQRDELDLFLLDRRTGREISLPALRDSPSLTFAPDASKIFFVSDRWDASYDLWVQPLAQGVPSGAVSRVTDQEGGEIQPAVSPDGRWVAYYRNHAGQRDIWIIPAGGGRPRQFTSHPAMDLYPAWAPDGTELAFVSEREGSSDIWIAPVSEGRPAGPPHRLTDGSVGAYSPAWSPGGNLLAFVGVQEGSNEVWLVPADGSESPQQVTRGANALSVCWNHATGRIWASGSWGEDLFILRLVSPEGTEPESVEPPVVFGPLTAMATFDLSRDGNLLVFSRPQMAGNIWVLEAEDGDY